MNTYVIMTDINADLPEDYIREHNLEILSLSYIIDGETYDRTHPLEVEEFYSRMRGGSMPTTSQVNPEQAREAFTACMEQGKDVLYIAFSSGLSGTYNSGRVAAEELKERFVLIYTGQRRLARNLLREVVGGYIGSNPNSIEVLYEIQRTAVLMKFELEKGNIDGFAKLLEEHWELSKRLDAGSTNTCIDQIFLSCQDLLSARMICGAGGGGFLQAVLKKGRTKEELRERIRSVFQDSGVDVWDCELVF